MLIGTLCTDSARRVAVTMTSSNVPVGVAPGADDSWASAAPDTKMPAQQTRTPLRNEWIAYLLSLFMIAPFYFCAEATIAVVAKHRSPNNRYWMSNRYAAHAR